MSRQDPQIKLRLPEKLRDEIKYNADINNRSMNAEILLRLEESLSGANSTDAVYTSLIEKLLAALDPDATSFYKREAQSACLQYLTGSPSAEITKVERIERFLRDSADDLDPEVSERIARDATRVTGRAVRRAIIFLSEYGYAVEDKETEAFLEKYGWKPTPPDKI